MKKIKRALISVSNKKNLKKLLKVLTKHKVKLISSGGTYREIKKLRFNCLEVSEYTSSPEILGGRVKTLHPKIHAGILSKRNNKSHRADLKRNNFEEIVQNKGGGIFCVTKLFYSKCFIYDASTQLESG